MPEDAQKKKDGSIFGMSPEEVRKYLQELVKKIPFMEKILKGLEGPEFPEHIKNK